MAGLRMLSASHVQARQVYMQNVMLLTLPEGCMCNRGSKCHPCQRLNQTVFQLIGACIFSCLRQNGQQRIINLGVSRPQIRYLVYEYSSCVERRVIFSHQQRGTCRCFSFITELWQYSRMNLRVIVRVLYVLLQNMEYLCRKVSPSVKVIFLLVYTGDVINMNEAERQERIYQKQHHGCYMYFYSHDGRHFW